jgi:hypothetical protein
MRIVIPSALFLALAPMHPAIAGGSADEIRKTVTGRTCITPGVTFHFGRDGSLRRHEPATGVTWRGSYKVSEGAILLNIQQGPSVGGAPVRGVIVMNTSVSRTTMHTTSPLGTVAFVCR